MVMVSEVVVILQEWWQGLPHCRGDGDADVVFTTEAVTTLSAVVIHFLVSKPGLHSMLSLHTV